MVSDSESSSDDDNLALLREAADTELINDKMFQSPDTETDIKTTVSKSLPVQKSQRYIADDDERIDDLLIPEEVQKFVSKKLAKIIENRVEFVDVGEKRDGMIVDPIDDKIKLLNDVVLRIDWTDSMECGQRKKVEIRKRKLPDVDDYKSEHVRLREAIVDIEDIFKEVNNWRTKPKGTMFEYVNKNGKLFEVEPKTEFTEKRKLNNWDESKISK